MTEKPQKKVQKGEITSILSYVNHNHKARHILALTVYRIDSRYRREFYLSDRNEKVEK